jgi:hypothetical protein
MENMAGIAVGKLIETSFEKLRSRHNEAWFGCVRGMSLERDIVIIRKLFI